MSSNKSQNKEPVPALLADDVPNAKRKVIWLLVCETLVALGMVLAVFFFDRLGWGLGVKLPAVALWAVNDVLAWQLWKSWAYRLTVTQEEIVLQLFCRKKKMPLAEIQSFTVEECGNSFARFVITGEKATLTTETRYVKEMTEILQNAIAARETVPSN